jgi:hypothetical protein
MGKAKKTRKFAEVKRLLHPKDIKCVGHGHILRACPRNAGDAAIDDAPPRSSPSPHLPPKPHPTTTNRAATDAVKKPFAKPQKEKTEGKVGASSSNKPGSRQRQDPEAVRHVDKTPSALFFRHNSQLGPPYQVLVDTNFINFSIKNKVSVDMDFDMSAGC